MVSAVKERKSANGREGGQKRVRSRGQGIGKSENVVFESRAEEEKEPAMQRTWGKHCGPRGQLMQERAWCVHIIEKA